ncbi:MAG TPA: efflux RND transporter periplasmic adaptor subunit [Chitinophagaceae bacterium]
MQKNIYWLLLIGLIAASCGNARKDKSALLNDKKAELQELKADQKELNDKIATLETEIAKLDTTNVSAGKPKLVAIELVGPNAFTHYVDLQGKIDAENVGYVAPRGQGGQIRALYVKQGQYVKKGQLLMKLDDAVVRTQLDQLNSQLAFQQDLYKRQQNLWKEGIGTEVQLTSARQNVISLQKQIASVQEQLSLSNVYAPISGVAEEVNVRVGEFFSPQSAATPGAGIRIVNTGTLKVVADVPENYLGKIGVGSSIQVQLPNTRRVIETKVKVAGKVIDPATRAFYIEAPIPSDPDFKPNQIAIVKIQDYATSNAITIPLSTLQNDESGKFVMVAEKEGGRLVARKHKIIVGELYGDRLEVKSGLQPGDQLITEGFQSLYEGQLLTTNIAQ